MEPSLIPPGHGESAAPGSPLRCPHCAAILASTYSASRRDGRLEGCCPEHGLVGGVQGGRGAILARARPDYDPRIDHPERYTDGPI